MEGGFGVEGVRDCAWWDAGGYMFRCFLAFCSWSCLGVVFRVLPDVFFWFSVASRGLPGVSRTSFLKEFREFPDFVGGSKSMAGGFSDISELRGTPEDEKR